MLQITSGLVFSVRAGTIGKQDKKAALFLDIVVPKVGQMNCSVLQDGLKVIPAENQSISAVVSGVRDFSGRIAYNLVPDSVQLVNGQKPPVPSGR